MTLGQLLVADPDPSFISKLCTDPMAQEFPPVVLYNAREAQQAMAEPGKSFAGIFISPAISTPRGIFVVKFAQHHHPKTPIYLLANPAIPSELTCFSKDEMNRMGIRSIIPKPITYTDLLHMVAPPGMIPDSPSAQPKPVFADDDSPSAAEHVGDSEFFPTRIENFLVGKRSPFEVFIRLTADRYVKILHADDSIESNRIRNYMQKGVSQLHLRITDHERYLAYCSNVSSAIIQNPGAWQGIRVTQALRHGEEVLGFLKQNGLSESSVKHAGQFISNVENLTKQLNLNKKDQLSNFLDDVTSYSHGAGTAVIAGLLARDLGIEAQRTVHVVGLASLLHDVSLHGKPSYFQDDAEYEMTLKELEAYRKHPFQSAEMLRTVPGIDTIVLQVIEQHHERRNHSGFPRQLGAASILQISELIGISDLLLSLMSKAKKNPDFKPLTAIREHFDSFSPPVVQSFKSVILLEEEPVQSTLLKGRLPPRPKE